MIDKYFASVSKLLNEKSTMIKAGFSTHHLSGGENREVLVSRFLEEYIPKAYGISTGLIISKDGEFSNQADILVVDQLHNAPLFPDVDKKIWFVESVYSMIEVKTYLSTTDIRDSIKKCIKFKNLERNFGSVPQFPKIQDSLFVIWAFDAPSAETLKANIVSELENVCVENQPDFIVVPNSIIMTGGTYKRISTLGQEGSSHRTKLESIYGRDRLNDVFPKYEFYNLKENCILTFLIWFQSWLKASGVRSAPLASYLDPKKEYGSIL